MNSAPDAPHTPHPDASTLAPSHAETSGSLHLMAGLVIGLAVGGALIGALLYWARSNQAKPWHGRIRDELAEQLNQLQKVAAAVAHEIERG